MEILKLLEKTREAAPGNPRIAKLEGDLQTIQKEIEQKRLELRPALMADLQSKFQADRAAYQETLKSRIRGLEEAKTALNEDVIRILKESNDFSVTEVKIDETLRRIQLLETIQSRMAIAIETMKGEKNAPSRVSHMQDEPVITYVDKNSNKLRLAILGSCAAFIVGLLLVAFIESRSQRIDSIEDVF